MSGYGAGQKLGEFVAMKYTAQPCMCTDQTPAYLQEALVLIYMVSNMHESQHNYPSVIAQGRVFTLL